MKKKVNTTIIAHKNSVSLLLPFMLVICMVGSIILNIDDFRAFEDYYFLYNRASQLLNCIKDKKSIMFFYNDLNGVGYGSTFFYGYITLLPFLPFVNMGYDIFFNSYFVITGLVFCFGSLYFTKKLTTNYVYIVTLYLLSTFVTQMFFTVGLITNFFAQGLGFLFLGFCIDFFRDKRNILGIPITFYLLLNTHIITTILCFLCCVVIWLYYFDKTRLREYLLVFVVTIVFCWFYFYNFFVHFDKNLYLTSTTPERLINNEMKIGSSFFGSPLLFFDFLFFKLFDFQRIDGYSLLGFPLFVLFIIGLYINRKTLKKIDFFIILMFFIGSIVGIEPIWKTIMNKFNIVLQFPMRFMFILLLLFFIVCGRCITNKHIFIICLILSLPNLFLEFYVNSSKFDTSLNNIYRSQIVNGEYVYKGFDLEFKDFEEYRTTVVDNKKRIYTYVEDKGTLYVKVDNESNESLRIRLPKIYYNGYVCELKTEDITYNLKPLRGQNGFIYVDIPKDIKGTLILYFDTLPLDILFVLNLVGIFMILVLFWFKYNDKNKANLGYNC